MRIAAWLFAAVFIAYGNALADEVTPEKRADIRQLIGVTGAAGLSGQVTELAGRSISSTLRRTRPDIPERVVAVVNSELAKLFAERVDTPGGLVDRLVAIYDKHFTHAEVKELLAFNQTPIGRKTLQVLPTIMSESLAAGQAWGQSLAPEVHQRIEAVLKKEGIAVPPRK